jgi:hypothetical protein
MCDAGEGHARGGGYGSPAKRIIDPNGLARLLPGSLIQMLRPGGEQGWTGEPTSRLPQHAGPDLRRKSLFGATKSGSAARVQPGPDSDFAEGELLA